MLSKDEALEIYEVLKSVEETVRQMKDNPLLVTQEDLDALEYDIELLNKLYRFDD